jgi:hypothetical protein
MIADETELLTNRALLRLQKQRRRLVRKRLLNQAVGQVIGAVVTVAAADAGCPVDRVMARGFPREKSSRARVAAMKVCVILGLPYWRVAKAFGVTKRSVHEALSIGRPGRERRDADMEARWRRIAAEVAKLDLPDFKRGVAAHGD